MKNRKLLTIGLPVKLSNLRSLLDSIDTETPGECIVRHHDRQLIVEEPAAALAFDAGGEVSD